MAFGGGGGSSAMNASGQSKQAKSNKQVSINDEQSPNNIININFSSHYLDNKSDDGGSKPQSPARPSSLKKIDGKSTSGGLLPQNPAMR